MNKLKNFLTTISILLLFFGISLMVISGGSVSGLFGKVADYNTVEKEDLSNRLLMDGYVYGVIDCIAEGYTETTTYGTVTDTTTDSFYYLIPFEDKEFMVIEIPSDSDLKTQIDALWEAFYGEDETNELLENGVYVSGVLEENESDLVGLFDEWKVKYGFEDYSIVEYTLDCTIPIERINMLFGIGLCMVGAFVVLLIIVIIVFFANRAKPAAAEYSYAQQPNYQVPTYNAGGSIGANESSQSFNTQTSGDVPGFVSQPVSQQPVQFQKQTQPDSDNNIPESDTYGSSSYTSQYSGTTSSTPTYGSGANVGSSNYGYGSSFGSAKPEENDSENK